MHTEFHLDSLNGRDHSDGPRHRWEDNIKLGLWEIWLGDVDSIYLAQNRDCWWTFLNMVQSYWFHKLWGIS
jgi:hypothetical protein